MCVQFKDLPAVVPGSIRYAREPALVLFKVVELHNGKHRSSRGLDYPIGTWVEDANARFGDHTRGIHMVPSEANARQDDMRSYGSHIITVLAPLRRIWTWPERSDDASSATSACWHTSGCLPIGCVVCGSGVAVPDVVPLASRIPLVLPAHLNFHAGARARNESSCSSPRRGRYAVTEL